MRHKRMWQWGVALLIVLLTACSGSKEEQQASENASGSATTSAESASDQAANGTNAQGGETAGEEPEPLTVTVETQVELRADRRVTISGETNLPDATQINVLIEREQSGVRWRERAQVADARFHVGPLGPGSGLPDGVYLLRVESMEASIQPSPVRQRIGPEGEYLAGEWVAQSRHGLGQVIKYSRRVLIGSESPSTRDDVEVLSYPIDAP
ncbi:hypothetical protein [Vreelandella massiliensis]|uniref:hypothetical protein n=1 Tax=Vreelandella massiliensis TaxID=1816686 RepID=UPI001F36979F|nr:hypothetical protein [Halomonas massiliensis]